MKKEFLIQTGEIKKIKSGLVNKTEIMYSGMPTEKTFVITTLITKGYNGYSPAIHYPKEAVFITIVKHRFKVLEVTPDYIVLHPEKIKKQ